MKEIDVTNQINYSEFDVEMVTIYRCICGQDYNYADFIINSDKTRLVSCKKCNREFYFTNDIKIIMVEK